MSNTIIKLIDIPQEELIVMWEVSEKARVKAQQESWISKDNEKYWRNRAEELERMLEEVLQNKK